MPMQLVLLEMELAGMPLDASKLKEVVSKTVELQEKLKKDIFTLHGRQFNLESPSEVAKVLGLYRKNTLTKQSTSKDVLSKIDSPIANLIIQYRKLSSIMSQTLNPISRKINNTTDTNRLYVSSFYFTSTGRIPLIDPNIQNVAKNFEIHLHDNSLEEISCRSMFKAPPGRYLLSADFCQLEFRILTHFVQDKHLLSILNSDTDVFTSVASNWFKIDEVQVTEDQRNHAKKICYGIIYGMGKKALSDSLNCDEESAVSLLEQFHASFPNIR